MNLLCFDVGSTYTKAALVDPDSGRLLASRSTATTSDSDVWDGVVALRDALARTHPTTPQADDTSHVLACSSAGGGLRLAVVGFEQDVTARAGRAVALSAGASVVHVTSGALRRGDVEALRAARADVVLLVGGTDGGNADILLHNAARLAEDELRLPVVVAGNRDASDGVHAMLGQGGVTSLAADNVLPRIGHVSPASARAAIRDAFLSHVIGGKHLSRHPAFTATVRRATPDAVARGVSVLRRTAGHDVLVVDVGGATTDVYSAVEPHGGEAAAPHDVVGSLRVARTVEADLGMRYSAGGVIGAATREGLALRAEVSQWAAEVASDPHTVAQSEPQRRADLELAYVCALIATRRHARPHQPTAPPRAVQEVQTVLASGGIFRREGTAPSRQALLPLLRDVGGGWRPPDRATITVDTAYVLAAIGLMDDAWPDAAASLAGDLVGDQGR